MQQLYGEDVNWISDGKLTGVEAPKYREKADYGFSNQRGASLAGGYACFKGFGWKLTGMIK